MHSQRLDCGYDDDNDAWNRDLEKLPAYFDLKVTPEKMVIPKSGLLDIMIDTSDMDGMQFIIVNLNSALFELVDPRGTKDSRTQLYCIRSRFDEPLKIQIKLRDLKEKPSPFYHHNWTPEGKLKITHITPNFYSFPYIDDSTIVSYFLEARSDERNYYGRSVFNLTFEEETDELKEFRKTLVDEYEKNKNKWEEKRIADLQERRERERIRMEPRSKREVNEPPVKVKHETIEMTYSEWRRFEEDTDKTERRKWDHHKEWDEKLSDYEKKLAEKQEKVKKMKDIELKSAKKPSENNNSKLVGPKPENLEKNKPTPSSMRPKTSEKGFKNVQTKKKEKKKNACCSII